MRFIIIPCHVTTQISRKKGKFDRENFGISKNWNVEITQSKDGEDRSSTESLIWNSDFYNLSNLEDCFRFLLPKWINPVRCDATGRPDNHGIYQWYLTYDVRGFVKEWLRAHNPEAFRISWGSEHDEECFVVSDEYVPGKYVKLE